MAVQQERKKSSNVPEFRHPQNILTVVVIILGVIIFYTAYSYSGWQFVLLCGLGVLIGFTLFHARFGFASVYRQIVETGNTEMLRAHMLMLAVATTLFTPVLAFQIGMFGNTPSEALSPISVGLMAGAFLFGFGMEIGSGLAPASMYRAEGGRTASVFTVLGFLVGAALGAAHFTVWNNEFPSIPNVSIALDTPLGYFGAWFVQMTMFAMIAAGSYVYKKRKRPPALPALPSAVSWKKIFFGSWPLWTGAVLLSLLNAFVFIIQGEPWKLTAAFTLWGAKMAASLGVPVKEWGYWGEQEPMSSLLESVFLHEISVLNMGVLIGTSITLTLGGLVRFGKVPLHISLTALLGGCLMGYGACISFGANIGAYFSGIASFSLHAWIWAFLAVTGTYAAYFLEKRLQFIQAGSKDRK
ncbi:hypothetical protein SAMN05192534_12611 [Alteribacillus persepolensis]|uniref:Uncharacterized protein n=1 Tax=Alteribacillus persepolensis TaxID=568899 RepID=A0A1G8ITB2_9BACI|nr:YeeE/YedE family protein [Alteribacillus persepolensis]SDI22194.1 hypothetical protein SAMN05192534_12611 [Alteribacillus persepolensis]